MAWFGPSSIVHVSLVWILSFVYNINLSYVRVCFTNLACLVPILTHSKITWFLFLEGAIISNAVELKKEETLNKNTRKYLQQKDILIAMVYFSEFTCFHRHKLSHSTMVHHVLRSCVRSSYTCVPSFLINWSKLVNAILFQLSIWWRAS